MTSWQNKSKILLDLIPRLSYDCGSYEPFDFKAVCAFSDFSSVSIFVKLQNESRKNVTETQEVAAPPPAEETVEIRNVPEVAVSIGY